MTDQRKVGRASQRKGAQGERRLAELLSAALGVEAHREGYKQRHGGSVAPDVDWFGSPFWCEVKVGASPNVRAALRQAASATDGRIPVVLVLDDGSDEPFVAMPFAGWARLVAQFSPGLGEEVEVVGRSQAAWRVVVRRLSGDEVALPLDWLPQFNKARLFVAAKEAK